MQTEVKTTFKMYIDPGHGWLAVKKSILQDLKILHRISSYSYIKGDTIYLEEDCDATCFVQSYEEKYGFKPMFDVKSTDTTHPIRSYQRFIAPRFIR